MLRALPGGRARHVDVGPLMQSYAFWDAMPTELVLTFQADSLLCRPLPLQALSRFAHVGAPWPDRRCELLQRAWRVMSRHAPSLRALDAGGDWCTGPAVRGTVGNSGLSLRRKSWMKRVIATCPGPFAALPRALRNATSNGCALDGDVAFGRERLVEDYYFAAALTGMGAPMPTPHEAAAFSIETTVEHLRPIDPMPIGLHNLRPPRDRCAGGFVAPWHDFVRRANATCGPELGRVFPHLLRVRRRHQRGRLARGPAISSYTYER